LGGAYVDGLVVEAATRPRGASDVRIKLVTPRFFDTMGIALRLGRDFSPQDRADAPKVAIVNETLVRDFFDGRNPIGKRIGVGTKTAGLEIVGVIADTKYRSLREPVRTTVYLPLGQASDMPRTARTLHVRTVGDPKNAAAAVREQVRALDRELPITSMSPFADLIDENLVQERLIATLSGCFSALALLLTCIGLYGAMAYAVQQRTREIGIRMSMGASRGAIVRMVMRECLFTVCVGLAMGLPPSLWLSAAVRSQLYGLTSRDPTTLALATSLPISVAVLAGYLPGRRASRIEPMAALRCE
jgi:predicted permease